MNKISTLWAAGTVALWTVLASGAAFAGGPGAPNQAQADHLLNRDAWAQTQTVQPSTEVTGLEPTGFGGVRPVALLATPVNAPTNAPAVTVAYGGMGGAYVVTSTNPTPIAIAQGGRGDNIRLASNQ